ncbi:MAG: acetylglutamate kinase [Clostridia bacterium]|nr:acetylglutamate kinase [Clostridia bacterium]
MMTLKLQKYLDLLNENGLTRKINADGETEITHISYNSQDIKEGALFICKGAHFKSEYLLDAISKGAVCYIAEKDMGIDAPHIIVNNVRDSLPLIANLHFDNAWEKINLVGITGTKGKSTTTYFMRYIFDEYMKAEGKKPSGVISSIDTFDGVENFESHLTTPEPIELHRHFDNAVKSGLEFMTMEVSSQALKYGRVSGVTFDVGCYLNIGYDHISSVEHPDFDDYFESKLKIFEKSKIACVCLDGERCERVMDAAKSAGRVITFSSLNEKADVYGYNIRKSGNDTIFDVRTPEFTREFTLTIPGLFNVQNALAAISISVALGVPEKYIWAGLMKARSDGRMEVYQNTDGKVIVIVDYAHNKMSFENLFQSVMKEFPNRKIYTVFGCPGNKAQNRRKDLGEIAGKFSNKVFLTEEDSGEEPTEKICREIAEYVACPYEIETDRGEAIRKAIMAEETPSLVLITGKGNETRQKRGTSYIPCPSDVEYTKKFLKEYDVENNLDCEEKLRGFQELLPALKKLYNKKIVVKLGGSVMEDERLFKGVFDDIAMLKSAGADVVIVHGGGKAITKLLNRLGIENRFENGYRVTDKDTAEAAEMVLSASVNKEIVSKLKAEGIKAVGISGRDASTLVCKKKENAGFVGEVIEADGNLIEHLLRGGYIPVVSPVSEDSEGNTLNVNADDAAFAVAAVLKSDSLVFVTDVDGLLLDVNNDKTLVDNINVEKARELIENGLISGGMLPKLKNCLACIEKGVSEVRILNGKMRYNLITSFISPENVGTVITLK